MQARMLYKIIKNKAVMLMYPYGLLVVVFIECLGLFMNSMCCIISIQSAREIGPGKIVLNYNGRFP